MKALVLAAVIPLIAVVVACGTGGDAEAPLTISTDIPTPLTSTTAAATPLPTMSIHCDLPLDEEDEPCTYPLDFDASGGTWRRSILFIDGIGYDGLRFDRITIEPTVHGEVVTIAKGDSWLTYRLDGTFSDSYIGPGSRPEMELVAQALEAPPRGLIPLDCTTTPEEGETCLNPEQLEEPPPPNYPSVMINGQEVTLPLDVRIGGPSPHSDIRTIYINDSWITYTGDGELRDAHTEVGDEDEMRPIFEALNALDAMEPKACALPGRDPRADCPRSKLFMIADPGPPPTWTLNGSLVTFPDDVWISGPNPRTGAITIEGGSSWVKLGEKAGRDVLLDFSMAPADEWWVQPLLDVLGEI